MSPAPAILSIRAQRIFRRAIVCLGLLAIALVAALITMRLAIHGAEVQVPDLRGMTAADAIRRASEVGLSATIADRFYSPDMPLGNVLTQFPEPGATVRRDWIVRLVQSLGPQTITIPNTLGMTQRDAVLTLRKAHLDLGTVAVLPYAGARAGTVIAQDPAATAHGIDRARVALLIASGAARSPAAENQATVPSVIGSSFQQAAQALLFAGFKLAPAVDASPHASGKPGIVIAQKPSAGAHAKNGSAVQLTVAR